MLVQNAKQTLHAAQGLSDSVLDSARDFFKNDKKAAEDVVARATKRIEARVAAQNAAAEVASMREALAPAAVESGRIAKAFKGMFNLGAKVIEVPVAVFVLKPIKMVLNGGASVFRAFPKLAPVVTVLGATAATANWFSRRQSKTMQSEFLAANAQEMAAMQSGPYTNSVSQSETDMLNQRLAAKADASQTEALAARAQVAAPEAAPGGR